MLNKGEILYYTFVLSAMRNLTAIYINKTVVTCTDDPNNIVSQMGVLDCIYNVFANANITKLKDVVTFLCELIF